MKLYIISGLGADFKVLEKLEFAENLEIIFLDWLLPLSQESFQNYVQRMADRVDDAEPFYLLGYSFGGIIVQEINKIKRAEKVVILGSIRSDKEKSALMKLGKLTKIPKLLPPKFYGEKSMAVYQFFRKMVDPKNPKVLQYFRVKNPYYLKWSVEKIVDWRSVEDSQVIQILGDKDIVFPIKNSNPDYIIKNGTHLFPVTKAREVSEILKNIFI